MASSHPARMSGSEKIVDRGNRYDTSVLTEPRGQENVLVAVNESEEIDLVPQLGCQLAEGENLLFG